MASSRLAFTGLKPTGKLHLGNYFGAIKWILENQTDSALIRLICIADMHSLTSNKRPADSIRLTSELLACGIDHEKTIIFKQSEVPEHTSLMWMLSPFCSTSLLSRQFQWKEKSEELKYNTAFFCYPLLQAADILLYRAHVVPVGKDQAPHIELTRKLAKKVNDYYKQPLLEIPKAVFFPTKIRSLQRPEKKMSKSDGERCCIFLTDSQFSVAEKIEKAKTDSLDEIVYDPVVRPELGALLDLWKQVNGEAGLADGPLVRHFNGYQELKDQVTQSVNNFLNPIRDNFENWSSQPKKISHILQEGAEKARKIAANNLATIKNLML